MTDASTPAGKERLKSIIERVEALEEDKKAIADDIRDVFAEAKGSGLDVKAIRAILRIRKDPEKAAELDALVETYMGALQMEFSLGAPKVRQGAAIQ